MINTFYCWYYCCCSAKLCVMITLTVMVDVLDVNPPAGGREWNMERCLTGLSPPNMPPPPRPNMPLGGGGLPSLCWIYYSLTKFDTLIRSIRDMQGQGLHHQLISCQSHFYAKPFHPLCQFHLYEIYWLTLVSVFICTIIHSDIAATSTSFSAMYVAEKRKELLLLLLCRSSLLLLCRKAQRERERWHAQSAIFHLSAHI